MIPEIEAGLKLYYSRIPQPRVMAFNINIFVLFFTCEDFDKALDWLNKIPYGKNVKLREDIQRFARVMQLVVHYELKNFDYLENLYLSTYRGLKRIDQLHEFERIVLNHIRSVHFELNKKSLKALWQKFYAELQAIENQKDSQVVTGLSSVVAWVEARLSKKPIVEILKAKKQDSDKKISKKIPQI